MKITIETIPHSKQRYPTVGDWSFDKKGNLRVRVSKMSDPRYTLLVGIHEAVEAMLCRQRGITDEAVTAFDVAFEKKRKKGNVDEPGDAPGAPYGLEHGFATGIERLLAAELGIPWGPYNSEVESLP